jgi:hypothetical protein
MDLLANLSGGSQRVQIVCGIFRGEVIGISTALHVATIH